VAVKSQWLPLVTATVVLMGCADAAMVGPSVAPPNGPVRSTAYDGSVPRYSSESEVPAEFWFPKIHRVLPAVYWERGTAVGSSMMEYYGNKAREEFKLSISGPTSISRTAFGESEAFWPANRTHTTGGFSLSVNASCGHHANLEGQHFAWSTIYIDAWGFRGSVKSEPSGRSADQPACTTDNNTRTEDKTEPAPGGGGGGGCGGDSTSCEDEYPTSGYTWCVVRVTYDLDTGEILSQRTLYCY